jgi:DnaB-like helicase C terminal domain.
MRNDGLFNITELRKAISQLKPDGELFEVRIIGDKINPLSGYFRDVETLIKAFDTVDLRNTNVYITLNKLTDALYSRQQADRFLNAKNTTSDKEVEAYDWLFIDLDPERPAGISSTDEELQEAAALAQKVYVYLKGLGFEEPVRAFSGNGYHLLYKIGLVKNDENVKLVERCLKSLSMMFSTDTVKIDTANFNPSRICKLYGTVAQKGSNSDSRPHRLARIDGEITALKQTSRIYLERLAEDIPEEPIRPAQYNSYAPSEFDIESWMDEHGIRYRTKSDSKSIKYVLDECPFDSNHKAPDSMIFKMASGAVGFKCLHDSCQGKTWQDVRIMYEPDAYEKKNEEFDRAIEEGWKRHNRDKQNEEINVENGDEWETVQTIIDKKTPDGEFIKTHIDTIDKKMHGLQKGGVSLWSGLRASAKSTILSQIALHAVNDGHSVLFYSGELTGKRFTRWLIQQAAGRQYVREIEKDESIFYVVPDDIRNDIAKWLHDRLLLYNNSYGSDYSAFMSRIEGKIKEYKPDLIVLDNLMTIDIMEVDQNEYRAQTVLMKQLYNLAQSYNIHIALVAHPRKTINFLRLMDISGSANISNLVDAAFIIHRVNHDFKRGYMAEFCGPKAKEEEIPLFNATNVIEIAKDRETGIQDEFIPLWYETESRRMLNEKTEVIKFKWTTEWAESEQENDFMELSEGDIPFE